jgi:hypothetical protein
LEKLHKGRVFFFKMVVKQAFFSAVVARKFGYCVYRSNQGEDVKITMVCDGPCPYLWPDVVFVGEVIEWISTHNVSKGEKALCFLMAFKDDPLIESATRWTPRIAKEWQHFLQWYTLGPQSPNKYFPVPPPE